MAAYQVTGLIVPDATTASTGEPEGTHNGQPYYHWTSGGLDYYLFFKHPAFGVDQWMIGHAAPSDGLYSPLWTGPTVTDPAGVYNATPPNATGNATVSLVVAPTAKKYQVLQATYTPQAGMFVILQEV